MTVTASVTAARTTYSRPVHGSRSVFSERTNNGGHAHVQATKALCYSNDARSSGLMTLNGDVLHEIASYIRGQDALNLSLTAHRAHDFAIHRVGSSLMCRRPADVRRIHQHLLSGHPRRVVFLRSLSIIGSTFVERSWQDDPNWTFPETTYEYSLAPLIGDILEAAPSLTHLHVEHFAYLAHHDSRIGRAISSMTRLVNLELCQVDSNALEVFQTFRSRPEHLGISTVKTSLPGEAKEIVDFLHEVLAAVAPIRELRALDLNVSAINCCPYKTPIYPREDSAVLPYVRCLSIHWSSQLLDIPTLFPNLDVLEQHISSFSIEQRSGSPLRRLSVTGLRTQGSAHQPVHLLQLRKYPRELQSFLRTIGDTSPVGLSLHSFVDAPQWLQYWEQLPCTAPRLRFMDVHCHMWERCPKAGWVARFLDCLRTYSLVCLRIVTPQPPLAGSETARWSEEDLQALAELPERLPQIMPSLRYVAWAAKRSTSEYMWYEDEYDCAYAEYQWYRVIGDDAVGQKLEAMSAGNGEQVRRFLLENDMDAIVKINDNAVFGTTREPYALEY